MTDSAQVDTAPVTTTDTAPDGNIPTDTQIATPQTGDTSSTAPLADTGTSDFSLPDEHKEKSWFGKVKSQEDIYKQLDNLTELVGKKTIQPIDYEIATSEQIEAHYKGLAPEDASKYDFGEGADPEFSEAVGTIFQKYGIDTNQAKGMAGDINALAATMAQKNQENANDGEKYLEMLKENFGSEYKTIGKNLDNSIKKYAKNEDIELLRDGIPNVQRIAFDRILHNILTKHGAMESGAQGEGETGGATIGSDVETIRSELRKQAHEIDSRPHTMEEKLAINNKLAATYKTS